MNDPEYDEDRHIFPKQEIEQIVKLRKLALDRRNPHKEHQPDAHANGENRNNSRRPCAHSAHIAHRKDAFFIEPAENNHIKRQTDDIVHDDADAEIDILNGFHRRITRDKGVPKRE